MESSTHATHVHPGRIRLGSSAIIGATTHGTTKPSGSLPAMIDPWSTAEQILPRTSTQDSTEHPDTPDQTEAGAGNSSPLPRRQHNPDDPTTTTTTMLNQRFSISETGMVTSQDSDSSSSPSAPSTVDASPPPRPLPVRALSAPVPSVQPSSPPTTPPLRVAPIPTDLDLSLLCAMLRSSHTHIDLQGRTVSGPLPPGHHVTIDRPGVVITNGELILPKGSCLWVRASGVRLADLICTESADGVHTSDVDTHTESSAASRAASSETGSETVPETAGGCWGGLAVGVHGVLGRLRSKRSQEMREREGGQEGREMAAAGPAALVCIGTGGQATLERCTMQLRRGSGVAGACGALPPARCGLLVTGGGVGHVYGESTVKLLSAGQPTTMSKVKQLWSKVQEVTQGPQQVSVTLDQLTAPGVVHGLCVEGGNSRLSVGRGCRLDALTGVGLLARDKGAMHVAGDCHTAGMQQAGFCAYGHGSMVTAGDNCLASGCTWAGFLALEGGAVAMGSNCLSRGNKGVGYLALGQESQLTTGLHCLASDNRAAGFEAHGTDTLLGAGEGCIAERNGGGGFVALEGARLVAYPQCSSRGNARYGFCAKGHGSRLAAGACCTADFNSFGFVAKSGASVAIGADSRACRNHNSGFTSSGDGAWLATADGCLSEANGVGVLAGSGFSAIHGGVMYIGALSTARGNKDDGYCAAGGDLTTSEGCLAEGNRGYGFSVVRGFLAVGARAMAEGNSSGGYKKWDSASRLEKGDYCTGTAHRGCFFL